MTSGVLMRWARGATSLTKSAVRQHRFGSSLAYDDRLEGLEKKRVTLIPGDGVGPELCGAVKHVFKSLGVPVEWDEVYVSDVDSFAGVPPINHVIRSMESTNVALMGVLTNSLRIREQDELSINQRLRTNLDLFANVVHCRSIPGVESRHQDIDFVVVREQTEGEYSALEHQSVAGVVEMLKVVTRTKSQRIAKFAFDYATRNNRKKVTCVHKANIMKLGDGLFLESCQEVAQLYPRIEFQHMIVDNACMQLVSNPQQFDVILLPNLYGTIINNIGAGLVGGAGVVPGKSFGRENAVFSVGAKHTFGGKAGHNVANPTAMLLSSCSLLEHIHLRKYARWIREAILKTIEEGRYVTLDVGGSASSTVFTNRVIQIAQLSQRKS